MRSNSFFGSSDSKPQSSASSIVAPEGNFRANEPSPFTDLLSLSQVKLLWIDELAIASASGNANAESSVWGGGLKARMLFEMKKFQTIPMKLLADAFPAASAYYRDQGCLRMAIEEAPSRFQSIQTSRWENAIASKKFAALVTVLRCPPLPTASRADGASGADDVLAPFSKRLGDVKALFQDPKFGSSLKRCIVFDPPAKLVSSLETDMFVIVKTSTPISELAKSFMHDIGADLVHLITSRVSALSLSASYNEAVSSFRTPMDKTDFGDGSMDPKSELAKVVRCRAAKRRGDLLLQLEAPDAALMAYGELSISSTDTLWTAAQLEGVASARYIEGRNVLSAGSMVQQACRAILNCSDLSTLPEPDLMLLGQIESDARDCLTKHRKAMLSLGAALPSLIKQRLAKEIEEPQADKVERLCLLIAGIRASSQRQGNTASSSSVSNPPIPEWCSAPDAASLQIQELYDQMTSLWFAEVELYLVEAYHQYRMLQPRLFELESELYVKLAWLRAEQRNPRKMLEAITDLNKTLRFVSPEAALRVSRTMPDVCMRCGCRRKAVHSAIEAAMREKKAQNYDTALVLLLKAAEWSGVPLRCDKGTGSLAYVPSTIDASVSPCDTVGVSPTTASPASPARPFVWREDYRNRGVIKVHSPARSHIALLFEMMDVLKQAGPVAKPGMRCQLAAAALYLYSDLMDACTQDSVLSVLQLESLMTPSYLQIMVVPPPLLISMQPVRLPPSLRPQTTSMGGAAFTYIDKERLKMTVLALNGQRLTHDVVWVAGESAVVEVALINPFDVLLQLTSVALHMEFTPEPTSDTFSSPNGTPPYSGALSEMLTPYVLNGLMMKPREELSIRLYALPRRAGTVHVKGIQVLLGQLAFVNPIIIPMDPVIDVPVIPPLPKVEILFSSNDIELFASQRVPVTCTITNVSHEEIIDGMSITAHRSACQLVNCNGCRERKHRSFIAANVAAREGFTVDIWKSVIDEALPLHPGESVQVPIHLIAPELFPSATFDHLFVRVEYHAHYDPPTAIPLGVPAAVPVFAIVPRRVADAKLRIFSTPSLEITNLSLTQDRRFVEVRVRNQCAQRTIELRINGVAPFCDIASSMFLLPAAELILPPVEISKLPSNRGEECVFQLPWTVRSGVAASYGGGLDRHVSYAHDGMLTLNLADVIKDVCSMEPLEEIVVVASFSAPNFPSSRSKKTTEGSAAASLTSTTTTLTVASDDAKDDDDDSLVQQQTWVNVAASRTPVFIPAVENVAVNIIISAPWETEVSLLVEVLFDLGADVGMVAGPVKKRVPIGRQDALGFQEAFDIIAFKAGEQFLIVRLTDDQGRCITHHIRLQVEHARQQ